MRTATRPTYVALDFNATRVQAAADLGRSEAELLPLEGEHGDLPLVVCLEGRRPAVGSAGLRFRRAAPHLACMEFLPYLGTSRTWSAGRHRVDAAQALTLILDRLGSTCSRATGIVLVLPPYLSASQHQMMAKMAEKQRWNIVGTTITPLAAALAAPREQQHGLMFVLDVDSHALTWSVVSCAGARATLLTTHPRPRLGAGAWMERLLDAVADRCIRQSRRDPRDSGATEQAIYDQLDAALGLWQSGQAADLFIQTEHWCQSMVWRPDEPAAVCAALAAQAVDELGALEEQHGRASHLLVTAGAARLPGIVTRLNEAVWELPREDEPDLKPISDFGEGLMEEETPSTVTALPAGAIAQAAHTLAATFSRETSLHGAVHAVPLPESSEQRRVV